MLTSLTPITTSPLPSDSLPQDPLEKLVALEAELEARKHEYSIDEYLMHKMKLKQAAIGKDPSSVHLGNFRQFSSPRTLESAIYAERYFKHCADRLLAGEWVDSYAIQKTRELRSFTNYADYRFAHILLRVIDGKSLISNGNRKWLAKIKDS